MHCLGQRLLRLLFGQQQQRLAASEADRYLPRSRKLIGTCKLQLHSILQGLGAGAQPVALGSGSAVTDQFGVAGLLSPKRRADPSDIFIFDLIGVSLSGTDFDTGGPSTGSASVP